MTTLTKPKSTRIKSTGLVNQIDFEVTVDRISYAQTELRQLEAERDAAVLIAQGTHADLIGELQSEIKAKVALCEKFAEENRSKLFPNEKKAKSAETPLSRYGFRTGMPMLKLLSKWTWDKVVQALIKDKAHGYLRVKHEADKQALLTDHTVLHIGDYGLRVVQDETFYIEPKVDGGEAVKGGAK